MQRILITLGLIIASIGVLYPYLKQREKKTNPYIFDSKAEAEAEARRLGCTGAQKMANKWMPCATN